MKLNNIVILNLGVTGVVNIRSFKDLNTKIYGFYSEKIHEIGKYSKYIKPIHYQNESDLIKKLIELSLEQQLKPVLFCSSDDMISFVLKNNDILNKHYMYHYWDVCLANKMINKKSFAKLLQNYEIDYPKTIIPCKDNIDSVLKKIKQLNPPYIIKPTRTFNSRVLKNVKNLVIYSENDMIRYLHFIRHYFHEIIIQEVIPHNDTDLYFCLGYFDENSKLRSIFSAQKIRSSLPKFGITSFAVSKQTPVVSKIAIGFLKQINYKGFFDIEFVYDKRDNLYKLLEINPRSAPMNSLANFCGVNITQDAYFDIINKNSKIKLINKQKNGQYWINIINDLLTYRKIKDISFVKYIKSLFKINSFCILDLKDIKPFIMYLLRIFRG